MKKKPEFRLPPIEKPQDIKFEAAVNLVADVLRNAHDDYITALRWLKKHETELVEVKEKVYERDEYDYIKNQYAITMDRITQRRKVNPNYILRKSQREIIRNFRAYKEEPPKPNEKEKELYRLYEQYDKDVRDCELFYKSKTYERFTLGKGENGQTLIRQLRREAYGNL